MSEFGLLHKSSHLAESLSVIDFIAINLINFATLCAAAQV
jgi:hypothetical protein